MLNKEGEEEIKAWGRKEKQIKQSKKKKENEDSINPTALTHSAVSQLI